MEITIHIGVPKTGSSALQSHLLTNRQWFRERGLFIPKCGFTPGSGHNLLFGSTDTSNARPELAAYLGHEGQLPELLDEVESIRAQGCDRVLLSWEGFAVLDPALIEKLAAGFGGYKVRLLAYLREQSELVESMILQRVKSNLWRSPLFDYLNGEVDVPTPWFLDFFEVLSNWKRIFSGRIAIETRIYERESLTGSDIVSDFAQWLGLPLDESFALQSADTNVSLDATGAALVSLASAAGLDRQGKTLLVQALLRDIQTRGGGTRTFLPAATLAGIRARYRQSNRRVLSAFPPTNLSPGTRSDDLFRQAATEQQHRAEPFLQLAQRLDSLVRNPEPVIWLGERLDKVALSCVSRDIGQGWRRPGSKGIWSLNDSSEIVFRIPSVKLEAGQVHLLLSVRGRYYGPNRSTVVQFRERCARHDLTNATLRLPLDAQSLDRGIHLTLLHDKPVSPMELEDRQDNGRLAFMLESLEYDLAWQ